MTDGKQNPNVKCGIHQCFLFEVSSFPDFQSDPGYPKMTFDIYYEEQQDSSTQYGALSLTCQV